MSGAVWLPPIINYRKKVKGFLSRGKTATSDSSTNGFLSSFAIEIPVRASIHYPALACSNLLVMLAVGCVTLFWALFIDKSYLKKESIKGLVRLQLQHPVPGHIRLNGIAHINPLELGMVNFTSVNQLPYCTKSINVPYSCVKQCQCTFLDEFDILRLAPSEPRRVMIPTRITSATHQMLCPKDDRGCAQRYIVKDLVTKYVADAEAYTLLVDHEYYASSGREDLGSVSSCLGFAKICDGKGACGLLEIPGSGSALDDGQKQALRSMWQEDIIMDEWTNFNSLKQQWQESQPIVSPVHLDGDIIYIKRLLNILGIDLDGSTPFDDTSTLRREGHSLIVNIEYKNWRRWTAPNRNPSIYVLSFTRVLKTEYKAMNVAIANSTERRVRNMHGLYITVRQSGHIGYFNLATALWMLVGVGATTSIAKFIVVTVGLCVLTPERADVIEGAIQKPVYETPKDAKDDSSVGKRRFDVESMPECEEGQEGSESLTASSSVSD